MNFPLSHTIEAGATCTASASMPKQKAKLKCGKHQASFPIPKRQRVKLKIPILPSLQHTLSAATTASSLLPPERLVSLRCRADGRPSLAYRSSPDQKLMQPSGLLKEGRSIAGNRASELSSLQLIILPENRNDLSRAIEAPGGACRSVDATARLFAGSR